MKRIEESGGSKYSIHKEAPQKPEPILPVVRVNNIILHVTACNSN